MAYRKFKADYIFTGVKVLEKNYVLITDAAGIIKDIIKDTDAGSDVEEFSGMLSPAFINCHCHLELSHMKNIIPERTGLVNFLIAAVNQRNTNIEQISDAMHKAEEELYLSGTVAIGDICNTTDTLDFKAKSSMKFYNFIEALGFTEINAADRFTYAKKISEQFQQHSTSIVPHAPYSVSSSLFHLINNSSVGKTISIHNQESQAENDLYNSGYSKLSELYAALNIKTDFFNPFGRSSLQIFLPWLNKAQQVILVHNTFSSEEDILYAQKITAENQQQLTWCICPNANLYIEGRMPPINLLKKHNCTVAIGTDSYASNWSLNMLGEIKKIKQEYQSSVSINEILQWATLNGAKALQLDKTLGSIEIGKQPGIILISNLVNGDITKQSTTERIL